MLDDPVHCSLERPRIDTAPQLFEGVYLMYYSLYAPEGSEKPP